MKTQQSKANNRPNKRIKETTMFFELRVIESNKDKKKCCKKHKEGKQCKRCPLLD